MNDFTRSVGTALSLIGPGRPRTSRYRRLVAARQPDREHRRAADRRAHRRVAGDRSFPGTPDDHRADQRAPRSSSGRSWSRAYLLLSRSGPLGSAGLLFTPAAMVSAQSLLAAPIVVALVHRPSTLLWAEYGDLARTGNGSRTSSLRSKASPLSVMSENRTSTKGCWRLNAVPRSYFGPTIRWIAARFSLPSALY
jgi:hypothetical protein